MHHSRRLANSINDDRVVFHTVQPAYIVFVRKEPSNCIFFSFSKEDKIRTFCQVIRTLSVLWSTYGNATANKHNFAPTNLNGHLGTILFLPLYVLGPNLYHKMLAKFLLPLVK